MSIKAIWRAVRFPLALIVGCVMTITGVHLERWQSPQEGYYDLALVSYQQQDYATAVEMFNQSLAAYEQTADDDWLERFVFPRGNRELAARSLFHIGIALAAQGNAPEAINALLDCLRLNPGNGFASDLPSHDSMEDLAIFAKYNLELLFQLNPLLARQQGAHRPGDDSGDPLQAPGDEPGDQPGAGAGSGGVGDDL